MPGRLGERSTHMVTCVVCEQAYGNAASHRCPFSGVEHANMHRETNRRIVELETRLDELEGALRTSQPSSDTSKEAK